MVTHELRRGGFPRSPEQTENPHNEKTARASYGFAITLLSASQTFSLLGKSSAPYTVRANYVRPLCVRQIHFVPWEILRLRYKMTILRNSVENVRPPSSRLYFRKISFWGSISFASVCSVNADKLLNLAFSIGRRQFGTCSPCAR